MRGQVELEATAEFKSRTGISKPPRHGLGACHYLGRGRFVFINSSAGRTVRFRERDLATWRLINALSPAGRRVQTIELLGAPKSRLHDDLLSLMAGDDTASWIAMLSASHVPALH